MKNIFLIISGFIILNLWGCGSKKEPHNLLQRGPKQTEAPKKDIKSEREYKDTMKKIDVSTETIKPAEKKDIKREQEYKDIQKRDLPRQPVK